MAWQVGHLGDSIKLYLKRCEFKALKPSLNLVNQMPGLLEHSLWYGLYLLVPRTNALKIFTEFESRVVEGRLFQSLTVDGKNDLNELFNLENRGLCSFVCLRLYVEF